MRSLLHIRAASSRSVNVTNTTIQYFCPVDASGHIGLANEDWNTWQLVYNVPAPAHTRPVTCVLTTNGLLTCLPDLRARRYACCRFSCASGRRELAGTEAPFFDRDATTITYDKWFGQRLLERDGHPPG